MAVWAQRCASLSPQLEKVLHTGRFDIEKARAAPGWLRSLAGMHVPESVEFGITCEGVSRPAAYFLFSTPPRPAR